MSIIIALSLTQNSPMLIWYLFDWFIFICGLCMYTCSYNKHIEKENHTRLRFKKFYEWKIIYLLVNWLLHVWVLCTPNNFCIIVSLKIIMINGRWPNMINVVLFVCINKQDFYSTGSSNIHLRLEFIIGLRLNLKRETGIIFSALWIRIYLMFFMQICYEYHLRVFLCTVVYRMSKT